jgi:hypothetical protein
MKARILKALLNNTDYIVHHVDGHVCVGSPMCHDLISLDKETLKLKYALDTFKTGRKSLSSKGLEFIWDRLEELIKTGQINDIIQGDDTVENPLQVFCFQNGKISESLTDAYGWPNTTLDGQLMYENSWFKTRIEALTHAAEELKSEIKWCQKSIEEMRAELTKREQRLASFEEQSTQINSELSTYTKGETSNQLNP